MRHSFYGTMIIILFFSACKENKRSIVVDNNKIINQLIHDWHKAAADANYDDYFKRMSSDAVFIGTDPTENWPLQAFKLFCKPHFDKGKAWNFRSLDRHIYFSQDHTIAWFDELLDTQMKICRGSGVLKKENGEWKIAHYVLSMTIPNSNTKVVTALKANEESHLIDSLIKQ